jgi:hypothetical protein
MKKWIEDLLWAMLVGISVALWAAAIYLMVHE